MKAAFFLLWCLALACPAFAAPPVEPDFVAVYEGESIGKSSTGRSFVLELTVTKQNESYSLTASMNDTNREAGMDHTSNSHWDWSGTGAVQGDCLAFTYDAPDAKPGKGILCGDRRGFILTLSGIKYRVRLTTHK
jgi:hypothetical protein